MRERERERERERVSVVRNSAPKSEGTTLNVSSWQGVEAVG